MAKSILVTADTDFVIAARNTVIKGIVLCAGGANATVEVFDGDVATGTSVAKLAAVSNESAAPLECEILTTEGISVDIGGSGAKAFIVYE